MMEIGLKPSKILGSLKDMMRRHFNCQFFKRGNASLNNAKAAGPSGVKISKVKEEEEEHVKAVEKEKESKLAEDEEVEKNDEKEESAEKESEAEQEPNKEK
ncbi:hypothetical protein GH714_025737 [Hevea brasiliensis]|uniref:Uncharacterized protein n=1 Tax=Hevea brasiliensis TaxID=3981 RepID=A0A6A6KGR8_HEVBR|nr:hypothetical protein GH714_025737 [Hevea brasiliensis]